MVGAGGAQGRCPPARSHQSRAGLVLILTTGAGDGAG